MNLNDKSLFNDTIKYDIWMLAYNLTTDQKAELTRLSKDAKYKCCYSTIGADTSFFYKYFRNGQAIAWRTI